MTYHFKFGRRFYNALFIGTMAFIIIVLRPHDKIMVGFYLFVLIAMLPELYHFINLKIKNKPVLTVTEVYIYDQYNERKYYWNDIREIVATEDRLNIYLNERKIYSAISRNPIDKFLKIVINKKPKPLDYYGIDLSMVEIEQGKYEEFVKILNDYSIKAEDIKNPN